MNISTQSIPALQAALTHAEQEFAVNDAAYTKVESAQRALSQAELRARLADEAAEAEALQLAKDTRAARTRDLEERIALVRGFDKKIKPLVAQLGKIASKLDPIVTELLASLETISQTRIEIETLERELEIAPTLPTDLDDLLVRDLASHTLARHLSPSTVAALEAWSGWASLIAVTGNAPVDAE